MNFDEAFARLIDPQHEGGYVADIRDPGGETNLGISKRSYPAEDIKNMTPERAKFLYRRDFWGPAGCDAVPDIIRYQLFDFAVNTSAPGKCTTAIKVLQRAVGAYDDGLLGPVTLMKAGSMPPAELRNIFEAKIIRYYTSLKNFPIYGAGWMNRLATNKEKV